MCEPWRFSTDFSDVQACFNLPLMPKSNKTKQIQNLSRVLPAKAQTSLCIYPFLQEHSLLMRNVLIVYVSHDMRFPTMWYVRPAKAQTSLRIRAVWSEPLLLAWIFYECWATQFLSSKGGYTGLSQSAHVKTPHSWRSHVTAHVFNHVLYVNAQWSWSLVFTSLKLCLCDNEGFIEKVPMNNEFLIWTFAWCLLEPAYEIWVLISCSPSVRSKEPAHMSRLSRNCRICTEHKNTSQTNPRHQEETQQAKQ